MYKIHQATTFLIPGLIVFAALYAWFVGGDTLDFAFLDETRWYFSGWVHPDAPVPFLQRLAYFVLWILPVAFGLWAVYSALGMLVLMRRGILFDASVTRRLRHVGIGTAASGACDFIANLIDPTVLSWTNPAGPEPITWYFDSEPAGLIFCGGGFYLIGWVIAQARAIADENEGFI